jgi:hypothetical protein
MAKAESVFVAIESGVCAIPGVAAPFFFRRGITRVKAGHPVLKVCAIRFEKEGPNARPAPDGMPSEPHRPSRGHAFARLAPKGAFMQRRA